MSQDNIKKKRPRQSLTNSYYLAETFHDHGVLLPTRTIYFGSEDLEDDGESGVDFQSVEKCIKNLLFLDYLGEEAITLYWNSPGGDWDRGIGLFDIIEQLNSPVRFIGLGMVRSMGTIVMQSCSERYLTPNCDYMIHDGFDASEGTPKDVEAWAAHSKNLRSRMYDIYLAQIRKKHPEFTKKKIEEMCSHDYIMTPSETVKLGLADRVIRTQQTIVPMEFQPTISPWDIPRGEEIK